MTLTSAGRVSLSHMGIQHLKEENSDTCYNLDEPLWTWCWIKWASHKRTNIEWFYLNEAPRVIKFMETWSRMVGTRGWGRRDGRACSMGQSFKPGWWKFWTWVEAVGPQQCEGAEYHGLHGWKWLRYCFEWNVHYYQLHLFLYRNFNLLAPMQFMGSQRVGHDWATEMNWILIFTSFVPRQKAK